MIAVLCSPATDDFKLAIISLDGESHSNQSAEQEQYVDEGLTCYLDTLYCEKSSSKYPEVQNYHKI